MFQLYCGSQFYWWRKLEYPEKTMDLPQVNDFFLSHNVVSSTPRLCRIQLPTLRVIDIDCIGSFKSNYHTIMTTTAPYKNVNWCLNYPCNETCLNQSLNKLEFCVSWTLNEVPMLKIFVSVETWTPVYFKNTIVGANDVWFIQLSLYSKKNISVLFSHIVSLGLIKMKILIYVIFFILFKKHNFFIFPYKRVFHNFACDISNCLYIVNINVKHTCI